MKSELATIVNSSTLSFSSVARKTQPITVSTLRHLLHDRADRTDARGHYTIGKEIVDNVIDRIRRVAGDSTSS